jgi:hypothetical protein
MKIKLRDIAKVIRSKNSGPYELTFDIIFKDRATYDNVVRSKSINRKLISRLYSVDMGDVKDIVEFKPANAIKATIKRRITSGSVGDTDIYGAQQHAPLMDLEIEI